MIPDLDWRRFDGGADRAGFVSDLSGAFRETGVLRLRNHGIDAHFIASVFGASRAFFDLTEAEKRTLAMRSGRKNRGWTCLGGEQLGSERSNIERHEAFNIGLDLPRTDRRVVTGEPFRAENLWPSVPGFRKTMLKFYDAALVLGVGLHRAIALDLGLPETHFDRMFDEPLATLRLVTYPPSTGRSGETGVGTHTDFSSITLLLTDSEPGLQIRTPDGKWLEVQPEVGSIIVFPGECLACWTGERYAATPHKVIPPRQRRLSLNFYVAPAPQTPMVPIDGLGEPFDRPQSFAGFLADRLQATQVPSLVW